MSKTLIKGSVVNSGAEFLGKGDTYRELYPKFKSGEIPYKEVLLKSFACWKGLKSSDLPKVYNRFEFVEGAKETLKMIKEMGIQTALLSNVATHLAEFFKQELNFDFTTGNVLEVKNGIFTGKIIEFHDDKVKEAMEILHVSGIHPSDAISIGDRKDDAKVFEKVKFGVAFNGDETARKAAKYQITNFKELINIIKKESN